MRLPLTLLLLLHGAAYASDTDDISKLLDRQADFGDVYLSDDVPVIYSPDIAGNAETIDSFDSTVFVPSGEVSSEKPKDKKITIAADGQPIPLDWTETGFPRNVPVYPSIPRSEFRWTTSSMKVSAMYFARSGSPGRRQASA